MLNNREIATAIWLTVFATWVLTKANVRASVGNAIRAFGNRKVLACVGAMILYTGASVATLRAIGFWQFSMIKDTVMWFWLTAFAMVLRFSTSRDSDNVMYTVLVDSVKLTVLIEFLIANYVMSLPAELVFVPVVAFIVLLDAVAKLNEEHAAVVKLTSFLLAAIGLAIFGFAVSRAIADFSDLGTMNAVRTIAFPPLMSIAFIPFIYVLLLVITYESMFAWVAFGRDKAPNVVRYARRRILFHCGLSLQRLRTFAKRPPIELTRLGSLADVDRLFVA